MNLHLAQLGLPELLVEPDQLTGGIPGGGQQPQVEVVAEVAVDGEHPQGGPHLVWGGGHTRLLGHRDTGTQGHRDTGTQGHMDHPDVAPKGH